MASHSFGTNSSNNTRVPRDFEIRLLVSTTVAARPFSFFISSFPRRRQYWSRHSDLTSSGRSAMTKRFGSRATGAYMANAPTRGQPRHFKSTVNNVYTRSWAPRLLHTRDDGLAPTLSLLSNSGHVQNVRPWERSREPRTVTNTVYRLPCS